MFTIRPKCHSACDRCNTICKEQIYLTIEHVYQTIHDFIIGGGCGQEYEYGPKLELEQYEGAGMDVVIKDGRTEKARFAVEFLIV